MLTTQDPTGAEKMTRVGTESEQQARSILAEQVKVLYDNMPLSALAAAVNSLLLVLLQWPSIAHALLLWWLAAILGITVIRLSTFVAYKRSKPTDASIRQWDRYFSIGLIAAAIGWGFAAFFLFPPNNIVGQVFLAFVMAGMSAGAIATLSARQYLTLIFIFSALLPLAVRFLMQGDSLSMAMAMMVFLFLMVITAGARIIHGNILENITSRVERAPREEALRRSAELLRRTGQLAAVGGWELELETMNLRWTEQTYAIHEMSMDTQPDVQQAINFYAPEARPIIQQAVQQAIEQGEPYDLELPFVTAKGNFRWVRAIATPQLENGTVVRLSGAFQDISERKFIEEALKTNIHSLERLHSIATDIDLSFDEKISRLLRLGCAIFNLPLGIISRIEGELYTVEYISGPEDAPAAGTTFELGNTYCCHTLEADGPVGFHHAGVSEIKEHPCYLAFGLESYIGTPLLVDGERYGTLNFSGPYPREKPYGESDFSLIQLFAQWIGNEISRITSQLRLVESEQRTRLLLESVGEGIYGLDAEGRTTFANPAAMRMLGYTAEELIGQSMHNLVHHSYPDGSPYPREECPMYAAFSDGMVYNVSDEVLWRKDGSSFPVEYTSTPVKVNDVLVGSVVTFRDITDRRRAENELKETGRFLQTMIDHMPVAIFVKSGKEENFGSFELWNKTSESMYGMSADQSLGKTVHDLFTGDRAVAFEQRDRQAFEQKEIQDIPEEVITSHNLGQRILHTVKVPLFSSQGEPEHLLCFSEDITERRLSERELGRFQYAMDNTLDMIFMFESSSLKFVYANKGAVKGLGYERDELLKMTSADIHPDIDEEELRELITPLISGEQASLNFDSIYHRKNGESFPVEVFMQWIAESGEEGLFVAIVRDITERKKIETMKNEFISTVSHELRTPLTSIRGSLGLLAGGAIADMPGQAKELIDIAFNNCERLIPLVNDILDMEKIASGKMKFDMQVLEVMPLIQQAIKDNQAYGKQFDVSYTLANEMEGKKVIADAERFLQVMSNLLSNAAKFSPVGATVEITVTPQADNIRVAVRDYGEGIPDEFQERIFQKFSQADASDTRQAGGTGLGLSISKTIIEHMNGTIGFDTESGSGSTFYFDLPAYSEKASVTASDEGLITASKRLLVCEDDHDIANLLAILLRNSGFSVDVAYNAEQAKNLLKLNDYDLMTLDLVMPGQDGISLIRELRSQDSTRELPIIVVSARVEEGRLAVNGDFSAIDWLEKPIDEQRLEESVKRVLVTKRKNEKSRVLHIEDDDDLRLVLAALAQGVADFDSATTLRQAREKLSQENYALVILDLSLPDGSGWDLLPLLKSLNPQPQVIILSASGITEEEANQVSMALVKSKTSNQDLLLTIKNAIKQDTVAM